MTKMSNFRARQPNGVRADRELFRVFLLLFLLGLARRLLSTLHTHTHANTPRIFGTCLRLQKNKRKIINHQRVAKGARLRIRFWKSALNITQRKMADGFLEDFDGTVRQSRTDILPQALLILLSNSVSVLAN